MKKILNPYKKHSADDYKCFGCSPYNNIGLQMNFYSENDNIYCKWKPEERFSGYRGILHGGIQATLFDEIASWLVFTKCGTSGVTARLATKYIRPVYIENEFILLEAKLIEQNRKFATIKCSLKDDNNNLCAEADIKFFLFPQDDAINKYNYPGADTFFE